MEFPTKSGKVEGIAKTGKANGKLWGKILFRGNNPVSGTCANGRAFTNAEIINWENGHTVTCD